MKDKKSYRDALTGGRNEFIGSPVMSGGTGGASGAPEPGHDGSRNSSEKKVRSSDKKARSSSKKSKASGQQTANSKSDGVAPTAASAPSSARRVSSKYRSFKSSGRPKRYSSMRSESDSETLATDGRLVPAPPDADDLARLSDVREEADCSAERAHHSSRSSERDAASEDRNAVDHLSSSVERFSIADDDDAVDASEVSTRSPPTCSPEAVPRVLLHRYANAIGLEERPAFVAFVLSLMDEPFLLDVKAVGVDEKQQERRERFCDHLQHRFTISRRDAYRLLQISYLVHRRFRARDDEEACEHVQFAGLAGRVVHEGDLLIPKHSLSRGDPSKRAVNLIVPETPVPSHRSATAPALPGTPSGTHPLPASAAAATPLELTLGKVCEHLRSYLPASLAEATVRSLEQSRRHGRDVAPPEAPVVDAKAETPAALGHGYRVGAAVGQLARAHRDFERRVQQLGARLGSQDSPESHLFPSDRMARFNPEDQRVLGTLRKVVEGHGEFKHLNSKQKLKAMSRVVREQLHQASLAVKAENDEDTASDATGDSCGSKSGDSRVSEESYLRDSFCASDSSPARSDGRSSTKGSTSGGASVSSSGSSSEGSNSDSEDGDGKRTNLRKHSVNSLGTPKKAKPSSGISKPPTQRLRELSTQQQLVLLGNEDLPMWKVGSAKFKNGFSWESYLHHKQAFDNYMAHRGRFSERTFKSVIHANLVPVVCASCGFTRSKWSLVNDAKLILRIERVLRPSRSTDFAMELKGLKITREGDEALQASYCAFAEKFLSKVAEAEDAGRPIKSVVVKAAFKAAIDKEIALKTWFEGDRWRGVNHAHARLLRKLREARSWEAISKSVLRARTSASNRDDASDPGDRMNDASTGYRRAPRRRANHTRGTSAGARNVRGTGRYRGADGSRTSVRDRDGRRGSNNGTRGRFNGTHDKGPSSKRFGSGTPAKGEPRRIWQGYDGRGESWHEDCDLFECYKRPCNAPFCQRCAKHGHTAESCRVPDGVDGLNSSGYFQEKRPGKAGPKRPPPRVNNTGKRRSDNDEGEDGSWHDSEDESSTPLARNRNNSTGRPGSRGRQGRNCL